MPLPLRLIASCLLACLLVARAAYPCQELPDVKDWKFLKENLVTLYQDPENFYEALRESIKACDDLHFIDMYTVNSPEKGKNLWISYVGDSLVREAMHGAIQRFGGYRAVAKEELLETLLPKHLGPMSPDDVNTEFKTYHQQQLMCCKGFDFIQPGVGHAEVQ